MLPDPSCSKPLPPTITVELFESMYAIPSAIEYMPSVTTSELILKKTTSTPFSEADPGGGERRDQRRHPRVEPIADEHSDQHRAQRHDATDRDVDLAHDDHHRLGDGHHAEDAHDAGSGREVVDREEVRRLDPHDHEHDDEHEQEPLALDRVDHPPPAGKLLLAPRPGSRAASTASLASAAAVVIVPLPIAAPLLSPSPWSSRLFRRRRTSREPHSTPDTTRASRRLVTGLVRRRGAGTPAADRALVYLQPAIGFVAVTSVPAMPMFEEYGILFAIAHDRRDRRLAPLLGLEEERTDVVLAVGTDLAEPERVTAERVDEEVELPGQRRLVHGVGDLVVDRRREDRSSRGDT